MQPLKPRFSHVAGLLALDFSNTVGEHTGTSSTERLRSFADLLEWAEEAGVIEARLAREVSRRAELNPAGAHRILKEAISVRETLYRIFSAISHGRAVPPEDIGLLNAFLAQCPLTMQVIPDGERFSCARTASLLDEARLLGPVAWSAAELLSSDKMPRVRECAGHNCGWLFLDLTKNRSRCWCAMSDCGSRAKARRYYQRKSGRA
jgi:predicted RNA-binding Zn ribbon-like protein